jgi:hypothetical protein
MTVLLVFGGSFVRNFCMFAINSKYKVYTCSINQEEWNFVSGSCNSVSVFFMPLTLFTDKSRFIQEGIINFNTQNSWADVNPNESTVMIFKI